MFWLEFFICKEGTKTISLDDVAALAASEESGLNFGCLASPNLKSIENTTFSNFFISDTKQQAFFAEPISAIPSCNIYIGKKSAFSTCFCKISDHFVHSIQQCQTKSTGATECFNRFCL